MPLCLDLEVVTSFIVDLQYFKIYCSVHSIVYASGSSLNSFSFQFFLYLYFLQASAEAEVSRVTSIEEASSLLLLARTFKTALHQDNFLL